MRTWRGGRGPTGSSFWGREDFWKEGVDLVAKEQGREKCDWKFCMVMEGGGEGGRGVWWQEREGRRVGEEAEGM